MAGTSTWKRSTISLESSPITPASIHVACPEKVEPPPGWSQSAVIELQVKTNVYRSVDG
jgi:hypothetical protein